MIYEGVNQPVKMMDVYRAEQYFDDDKNRLQPTIGHKNSSLALFIGG